MFRAFLLSLLVEQGDAGVHNPLIDKHNSDEVLPPEILFSNNACHAFNKLLHALVLLPKWVRNVPCECTLHRDQVNFMGS